MLPLPVIHNKRAELYPRLGSSEATWRKKFVGHSVEIINESSKSLPMLLATMMRKHLFTACQEVAANGGTGKPIELARPLIGWDPILGRGTSAS